MYPLSHSVSDGPRYWAYETGGELSHAMKRYLSGHLLSVRQIALIAAYLRQWIDSPVWDDNPYSSENYHFALGALRRETHGIRTAGDLDLCVEAMIELGMDPL